MHAGRTLSRGDIHLLIAGVFFGTFVLVRMTDPSDYGLTLHPRLDKVWTMWRMIISAGWLGLALLIATLRKTEAYFRSFSFAAASATALGLITLSIFFPQSSSWWAIIASLAVYAATSGVLCLKVSKPIHAALLGAVFFVLQGFVDAVVHFLTGVYSIH